MLKKLSVVALMGALGLSAMTAMADGTEAAAASTTTVPNAKTLMSPLQGLADRGSLHDASALFSTHAERLSGLTTTSSNYQNVWARTFAGNFADQDSSKLAKIKSGIFGLQVGYELLDNNVGDSWDTAQKERLGVTLGFMNGSSDYLFHFNHDSGKLDSSKASDKLATSKNRLVAIGLYMGSSNSNTHTYYDFSINYAMGHQSVSIVGNANAQPRFNRHIFNMQGEAGTRLLYIGDLALDLSGNLGYTNQRTHNIVRLGSNMTLKYDTISTFKPFVSLGLHVENGTGYNGLGFNHAGWSIAGGADTQLTDTAQLYFDARYNRSFGGLYSGFNGTLGVKTSF